MIQKKVAWLKVNESCNFRCDWCIEKNDNYIKRLKDFGAIIEINASSNIALNNIDNFSLLPYDYYLKNGMILVGGLFF
jgi:organic radical activating enzyme